MEIKKIRWQKIILAMPVLMMLLFCTGLNVHAEEVKDGISVTVSSDKKNYSSEDEVKLKIMVKNTNDFEVSDIKIENILPDGISLISGDISKDNINLKANEETIMNLSVKKVSTGQTATTINTINNSDNSEKNTTVSKAEKFPNTGDNNNTLLALIVMLVSVAVIIVCLMLKDRKKYSKFLSVLICLGVINAFEITGIIHATSTSNNSFTYEFTYKIDNADYIHKVVVSYSLSENNNNNSNNNNNNSNNNNNTVEEKKLQDGYLLDVKDNFVSSYNFERVKWNEVDKNSLDYLLLKNVYIKIENAEYKDNNTGTANIVITAPDLEDLLIASFKALDLNPNEYINGEEFQKYKDKINNSMCNMLKNSTYKKIDTSLNVNTTKINQTWKIEYTEDVHEAITCRVNELFEKYVDKMFKGE
ncbi:MAG: DUF11 domain-containing protein [Ruminococcus flavefaciens]|nr:DUF11 domain-containing protein [Ruminococcus flavefaciens]MCM1229433.1 DUF11 domain-containing protein [Ruminococcus flavefaciens]